MYLCVSIQDIFDIAASELVQFLVPSKDNDGDFGTTKHSQLKRLFEQSILAFEKRNLYKN